MLMDGVALKLAPKVNVFQELRYDNFSDTVGLWEALGGIDIELNPDYRKTVEWSPSEIQQMIAPGEVKKNHYHLGDPVLRTLRFRVVQFCQMPSLLNLPTAIGSMSMSRCITSTSLPLTRSD